MGMMQRAAGGSPYVELGTYGGKCFRATCNAVGANWYHQPYRRYYCGACAAEINELRAREGEVAACVRR